MDKFRKIFIAEAEEMLHNLEATLLSFEQNLANEQSVKEIFRIMHTLKGGAGMFGFDPLRELTHELETIYDKIREGEIVPSSETFDITLAATDHLKSLLYDHELKNSIARNQHQSLMERVRAFLAKHAERATGLISTVATYHISVELSPTIFSNGTNPLYLIQDLTALGKSIVLPSLERLATWPELDPVVCYTSFEVLLATAEWATSIEEVFMFAEGQCKVEISVLDSGDMLMNPAFTNWLALKDLSSGPLGIGSIKSWIRKQITADNGKVGMGNVSGAPVGSESSIRVASGKLDEMMSIVSELVTMQARLSMLASQHVSSDIIALSEDLEKVTRRLRDNAFSICLVPVETITTRFQRLVRDLSAELGKQVRFTTSGTETELDKAIMERITDPILHIIRNGLDHGIELPGERRQKGKPEQGTLHLEARQVGTMVYISISDDGKGMDVDRIKQKAVDKGLIDVHAIMSEDEILQLVFEPGFSTAETLTDISGRGVGMDIVKRNIETLQGTVHINSAAGKGSTVTIQLPLTLSIIDGLLIRLGNTHYIIPVGVVEKCYEFPSSVLEERIMQRLVLDGELVPVLNLHEAFHVRERSAHSVRVIRLRNQRDHVAITVDDIFGEYQAVMKPLGEWYSAQDEFSGASILGDGSVALALDVDKLLYHFSDEKAMEV